MNTELEELFDSWRERMKSEGRDIGHPDDFRPFKAGYHSRDAEVAALQADKDDLGRWKAEAIKVEMSWDIQAVGTELGMDIGTFIPPKILPAIQTLQAEKAELVEALKQWLDADWLCLQRGDTPETRMLANNAATHAQALIAKHGKEV